MKIKQKKQLNLPQLIEYIFANNLKHKWKDSDNTGGYIHVYDDGRISVDKCTVDSTFTVEVEEEINECSDIKRLAHYTVHGFTSTNFNKSIGELRKSNSLAFYIMNDDRTLTLIWTKEKGMVE